MEPSPSPNDGICKEIPFSDIGDIKEQLSVLLITVTSVETEKVRCRLKPLPAHKSVLVTYASGHTYYLGTMGNYAIVHVQSRMGAVSAGASLTTIMQSIDLWKPKAAIMVGIAFGMDSEKQQIGDVLVSDSIISYDPKRVGKDHTQHRGIIPPSGNILLDRIRSQTGWDHKIPTGENAKIIIGPLLSGESLIDNANFKKELADAFPTAVGGEMEGAGLNSACSPKNIEWMIIKGICDYGDGDKATDKETRQSIAAESSASFCEHLLLRRHAFDELGFLLINESESHKEPIGSRLLNEVLFDVYTSDYEIYYLERSIDQLIADQIRYNSFWVSGDCGCGKTTLIRRNLVNEQKDFIFIDLSSSVGEPNESLLFDIYIELSEQLKSNTELLPNTANSSQIIKEIIKVIVAQHEHDELVIDIDEIPISDVKQFENFLLMMNAIQIGLSNSIKKDSVRFIASSICNPADMTDDFQKKIHEKLKFQNISNWTEDEIRELLELIVSNLNINFSSQKKDEIIQKSNGSPRFIKKFIRNFVTCNQDGCSFNKIMADTIIELK